MIGHLDRGALVRRLDGELEPGETGGVEAHLATCLHCRAELDAIARLSARVSAALPLVDHAPAPRTTARRVTRSRRPRATVWRAAAMLALVAGLALAIAPVRAWIAGRLGLGPERPALESTAATDTATPAVPTGGGVRVAFVPTGDRFRVLVAVPQLAGSLQLHAAPGDTATGEVLGPGDADLLVLPDGLGIRNARSFVADYGVVVPADVREIEVRVGDRVAWAGAPSALPPGGTRIDLSDDGPKSDR